MSENIDINVGIIKEEISINAANNIVEVNISTAPVTVINPQNYDLSQFTNTSPNPFIQQSSLSSYVPISRIITINGVAQDLSTDRSWTISVPSITGLVPYIGANANVNLGEYELTAGQLTLDTSPTGVATVGTTRWNNTIGSSETTLKGGSVILKNGVDLVARVVNKVTPNATLTKANYTAVRVSGAQGQRLAVAYAQANNDTNSADTLGLVTETIPTNQEGFIITVGQLEGINTTGSLQGESWSDGDVLYLSPTTPGAITNIKPSGITGHIIVIGYVEYAHANNGKIYVKIMNGWELDELHNVYIDPLTLANNNILQYDSSTQLWRNQVLSTGITIGTTAITSGTVGRVLFEGTGNVVQESANLFWDNTNARLGIGTSSPASKVDILQVADNTSPTLLRLNNTGTGSATGATLEFPFGAFIRSSFASMILSDRSGATVTLQGATLGTSASNFNLSGAGVITFTGGSGTDGMIRTGGTITFNTFSGGYRDVGKFFQSGNFLIQTGGTFTDAGFRLDVNGTARVSSLTMPNFSTITSGNNYFSFETFRTIFGTTFNTVANQYAFNFDDGGGSNTITSGTTGRFQLSSRFAPTSGTAVYNSFLLNATINQTGGANGITRGLYINPTLTASTDFRAIETTAGNVLFGSNFFWDNTNGRLGIGTSSPSTTLHVVGQATISTALSISGGFVMTEAGNVHTFTAPATNRTIRFITNSQSFSLFSTGNFAINTTTDAGFKLDVNGTARVRGTGTTSATTAFTVQNSAGTNLFFIQDNGAVTSGYIRLDNNGSGRGRMTGVEQINGISGAGGTRFCANPDGALVNNSAQLQVDSTDKGFLPPRMTTTQKNAIASPAAGLQIFDTTLNRPCFYDGTTWITL